MLFSVRQTYNFYLAFTWMKLMKTFNKAVDLPNLLYEALPTTVFDDLSSTSLREEL